jgi:hypothetical protein
MPRLGCPFMIPGSMLLAFRSLANVDLSPNLPFFASTADYHGYEWALYRRTRLRGDKGVILISSFAGFMPTALLYEFLAQKSFSEGIALSLNSI